MIENQGSHGQKIVTIYDDIYNLPDCRSYYRAMDHAGFRTAHFAATAFRATLAELKRQRALDTVSVMDFASGYGIAAALMRYTHSLDDVLARYRDPWFNDASNTEVLEADKAWFAQARREGENDRYAGIDIADQALAYGNATGIFDSSYPENLQDNRPSPALAETLAGVDLIVECGSVAHMLPKALDHMLSATTKSPWIAMAPIRGNDTAEAMDVLAQHGLQVDTLGLPPFPHRRFSSDDEQARAIANAAARGYETEGYESKGFFHAQILLARPKAEAGPIANWPNWDTPGD